MRGLCVDGDMAILFFGDFAVLREKRPPEKINKVPKNWNKIPKNDMKSQQKK